MTQPVILLKLAKLVTAYWEEWAIRVSFVGVATHPRLCPLSKEKLLRHPDASCPLAKHQKTWKECCCSLFLFFFRSLLLTYLALCVWIWVFSGWLKSIACSRMNMKTLVMVLFVCEWERVHTGPQIYCNLCTTLLKTPSCCICQIPSGITLSGF